MFKTVTIGLLAATLCVISVESAQAFGGRRRAAQSYAAPAPVEAMVAAPQYAPVAAPQYYAPQYQAPARRQPQDANYAYPKTDMRRYNFQYTHN